MTLASIVAPAAYTGVLDAGGAAIAGTLKTSGAERALIFSRSAERK